MLGRLTPARVHSGCCTGRRKAILQQTFINVKIILNPPLTNVIPKDFVQNKWELKFYLIQKYFSFFYLFYFIIPFLLEANIERIIVHSHSEADSSAIINKIMNKTIYWKCLKQLSQGSILGVIDTLISNANSNIKKVGGDETQLVYFIWHL